ncbi:oligosaccharide flippase family protein [Bacteroides cellulosilyticus]|jgi:O-antigen/teichoic acid export membrane protein|uniref:Multidrug transporter n=1 Tax=Bacteroides cellulosilyticus TaxID=246787 RepID=A0A412IAP4_9BACE|nr:oligosaccharide flippase family protein [Bacteroides cellulosilyticus]RGS33947.1 multidrug transporter [Bacteroides cellulosilyticus]
MSDNKRIAKNTVFLYFRMLLIMGVSLYISRVILSILGVEDFGIYNVVGGIVVIFTTLCGSLGSATSRYITFELGRKDYEKLNRVFSAAFMAHCAIALLIVILCETVGLWLFYKKMIIPADRIEAAFWVFQISLLTTVFSVTQVPYNACIIAHENMKIYAYVSIVEVLLKLAVVYALLISPIDKLVFYSILLCVVQVSVMFIYRFYCRQYPESKLRFCKDRSLFIDIFSYAGSDMIGSVSVLAQGQGLNILLNMFYGPVVNAARAIAYQLQSAVTQFSGNFFTAVRPQIIKLYAECKLEEMMRLVYNSSWISYYMLLMVSLPLCFERNFVLSLWLGEYPDHTSSFIILIIILCLIQALKTPRTTVYHATGHILRSNIFVGGVLCMAFPLAYLFLKLGGSPESVFWAANISMIVSEFVSMFILRRYIKYSILNYFINIHCRCFGVSMAATVILYYIQQQLEFGWCRLILMSLASVIITGILAYMFGIDSTLRNGLNRLVRSKIIRRK